MKHGEAKTWWWWNGYFCLHRGKCADSCHKAGGIDYRCIMLQPCSASAGGLVLVLPLVPKLTLITQTTCKKPMPL